MPFLLGFFLPFIQGIIKTALFYEKGGSMHLPDISFSGFEYDRCTNPIKYSIHHEKPLELSPEMTKIIEYLLWYMPNIDSIQSPKNELVESLTFDTFTFNLLKSYMGLTHKDVVFLDFIDEKIAAHYSERICPDSEKLILTLGHKESMTAALLRHVRNAIAHGFFNLVGDLFIGFDYRTENGKPMECTAILKIRPASLLEGLKALNSEVTVERLATIAFQETGYRVEPFHNKKENSTFDFHVSKKKKHYAVEVKKYPDDEILPQDEVERLVRQFEHLCDDFIPVLFINTSLLTEESKQKLLQEHVILLDSKNIQKMLQGRDMLAEIDRDNQ